MNPKVSILIRTCQRPKTLSRALKSIREQTYKDLEVIVVEDGNDISKELVKSFSDLSVTYHSTGHKVGRSAAGNIAMSLAKGSYFNFLDDDDWLLPNHVEVLVTELIGTDRLVAYGNASECLTIKKGEKEIIKKQFIRHKQPFSRLLLLYYNYLTIQEVMFSRTLYEQYGGMDVELDAFEDWDIWIKYAMHADFVYIDKVTSCYCTPYDKTSKQRRAHEMKKNMEFIRNKIGRYKIDLDAKDLQEDVRYLIEDYRQSRWIRNLKGIYYTLILHER